MLPAGGNPGCAYEASAHDQDAEQTPEDSRQHL
jgi:hypothetical protein